MASDNGPQFSSSDFTRLALEYRFTHVTSSPHYHQSNRLAESAVKIIKSSVKKTQDPYLTFLAYRSTPLKNGYSPSDLLMGRRLRTKLPVTSGMLVPRLPDATKHRNFKEEYRAQQRRDYDRRHGVRQHPILLEGNEVCVTDVKRTGNLQRPADEPRSYIVGTGDGAVRRNRTNLVPFPKFGRGGGDNEASGGEDSDASVYSDAGTDLDEASLDESSLGESHATCVDASSHHHTMSGRCVIRPKRLSYVSGEM
ncbi:uncharacterized protein LOC144132649 [Amblyomma americanum]